MEYQSNQKCAFPPCTNSFPRLNRKKKYCSGCCRVKDFNRRKRKQEKLSGTPDLNVETRPSMVEPANLAAPSITLPQAGVAQVDAKKGMTLAGVGEAAIGTAGVMLLKDRLFDKDHRVQLQQQMNQLLHQQAWISRQLQELKQKMDQFSKAKEAPNWPEKLMM